MLKPQGHNTVSQVSLEQGTRLSNTLMLSHRTLLADPGVISSIPAQSHTFTKIDHEIISTAILLPSADSRRAVFQLQVKVYVHGVLVKHLVKLAKEKVWLCELTVPT